MKSSSRSTLLIVDDNYGARYSIEALLAQDNFRFVFAQSGQEALDILEEETPDLILLDVMMPGMNGYETCRKIREIEKVSEVPIIMLTALDDEESMIEGIEAGADDFLPKPINKLELRSRIRSIIRLNRFRKLCNERHKFELVVAQSNRGFLILDSDNRIRFSNTSARKMLEQSKRPFEEDSFFSICKEVYTLHPFDIEQAIEKCEEPSEYPPFTMVRKEQSESPIKWIQATFHPLGLESGNQKFLRLEDITEQITSFREKHTFSRMMSHKLLTPLNTIKAAHQMLGASPSESQVKHVAKIQESGIERLEYDIRSILAFLDSENSQHSEISLQEARQIIETVGADIQLLLKIETQGPTEDILKISAHDFEACVREICENAVKFSSQSTPTLEIEMVSDPQNRELALSFLSNSNQLSSSELANVWRPYWQADRYQTGEVQGMGLGLALVAANVWSAGGTCSMQNHPSQKGVLVSVTLPFRG
ncbi:response regulator [Pelagicoccus albus]|uniref:histidine kinase n=1 Tax=Pelagicoccus albus TaxID=415222 RepID=A0A7X1B4V2_9BACT|nr:response regulator [Pelagicoccus albus]MBC2605699.1 response regulator [Pelagicoccus albus]